MGAQPAGKIIDIRGRIGGNEAEVRSATAQGPHMAYSTDHEGHTLTGPPGLDPLVGRVIGGNFRIVKIIGAGAMGTVYQAEQKSLSKMVAIKILRGELMGDEKLIKRFELEAKNASSLNHPNSIQIIDFGHDQEVLYIAMELLTGLDLNQILTRDGPLALQRAGRVIDQVLSALDEAHANSIVHRDLKPGNIMIVSRRGDPDFVKVCDFGIAKCQTDRDGPNLTMKGLVCGTPEYMSPEQARGEDVDGRADLYAVGVIFYQLVTGELPFSAGSPVELLGKHLAELPLPPSQRRLGGNIPPLIERLILRALAKSRAERPQTAADFQQELRIAMSESVEGWLTPVTPMPISMGVPTLRPPSASGSSSPGVMSAYPIGSPGTPRRLSSRDPLPAAVPVRATGFTPRAEPRTRRRTMVGLLLVSGIAAAIGFFARSNQTPAPAGPVAATTASIAAIAPPPAPVPVAAPQPPPPSIDPPPVAELPPVVAEPPRPAKIPVAAKIKRAQPAKALTPRPAVAVAAPVAAPPVAVVVPDPVPTPSPATPPPKEDAFKEAERLLGQGEVPAACKKAEESRRMNPKNAALYKFLGKCYMRAGDPALAKQNYIRYLELNPEASDRAFIQSIVK